MMQMRFKMTFNTPAFIGDAERKGAMRSPPIKALLRHFWRIEKAPPDYDHLRLVTEEGILFGSATDKAGTKSLLRLKLGSWEAKMTNGSLPQSGTVRHPEVNGGRQVGADLYLGYGPVGQNSKLTCDRAIAPGKDGGTELCLAFPREERDVLFNTLRLIQAFGTVGGRSRNGWGSLSLAGEGLPNAWTIIKDTAFVRKRARHLSECLEKDWPHAIGLDDKGRPLIWTTHPPKGSWNEVIKDLAEVKIKFRTIFPFRGGEGPLEQRHIIAYPVTRHKVSAWSKDARVPNQLRFKVIEKGEGAFVGLAFHIPCSTPSEVGDKRLSKAEQMEIWKKVHAKLDTLMQRV
jgi:CRISPR-associated protein Cmr1